MFPILLDKGITGSGDEIEERTKNYVMAHLRDREARRPNG